MFPKPKLTIFTNKRKSPNTSCNQLKAIAMLQNQIVYDNYKWQGSMLSKFTFTSNLVVERSTSKHVNIFPQVLGQRYLTPNVSFSFKHNWLMGIEMHVGW
jgi:hypothetical protein